MPPNCSAFKDNPKAIMISPIETRLNCIGIISL